MNHDIESLISALAALVADCTPADCEPNARGEIRSVSTPDWRTVANAREVLAKLSR